MPDREYVIAFPQEGMEIYYERGGNYWVFKINKVNSRGVVSFKYAHSVADVEEIPHDVIGRRLWGGGWKRSPSEWEELFSQYSVTKVEILSPRNITPDWEV